MKSLNKKLIIFDLDGTILDTIADIAAAVNSALDALGFPNRTVAEIQSFLGNGSLMLMRRSLPSGADDELCNKLRVLFRAEHEKKLCETTAAYKGIPELIDELITLGAVCAVISNKDDRATVPMVMRYFGERFAYIRGVRGDTDRKPNPEVTLSVISELGFTREQTLFVGDGVADFEVSKNAEIEFVPVGYGYTDKNKLFGLCGKEPSQTVSALRSELIKYFERSEGVSE